MKAARWYSVEGGTACIYDAPYSSLSRSVSVVRLADLAYYRSAFNLRKIWGERPA